MLHLSDATAVASGRRSVARNALPPGLLWAALDAVVLLLLSFALIPASPSDAKLPERLESMLLIMVYAAYLVAETALSARLIH